jgi:hypothetical protein
VKPEALALLDDTIGGKRPYDFLIWRIISFGRWVRRFNVAI